MKNDDLGNRMKLYEQEEAGRKLNHLLPIIARIDGRCFSNFTAGLERPFDTGMSSLMVEVTKELVREFNCNIGYTQSDEITLVWIPNLDHIERQMIFGAKVAKLNSILASSATMWFHTMKSRYLPDSHLDKKATFDCRVWNVPSKIEATNCLVWREIDCMKNSVSMAAMNYFSHKALIGKTGKEKKQMLLDIGVDWDNYPNFFRRGSYIQKVPTSYILNDVGYIRHELHYMEIPLLKDIKNKSEVLFDHSEPILKEPV